MAKLLHIVNTKIEPFFLDLVVMCEQRECGLRGHADFIKKVRTQYAEFNLPYLALFQDGQLRVPDHFYFSSGSMGEVINGIVGRGGRDSQDCRLDEFIDRFKIGDGVIYTNEQTPITAVVEFSPTELYPTEMERLAQKYELKRILVE